MTRNDSAEKKADPDNLRIALRAEQSADEFFLLELYASVRQEELNLTGWDAATRAAFVKMQFAAMRQGYAATFPRAQFSVIESNKIPVGRMVVSRTDHEIRLVDLALLPDFRNQKIGTHLLQTLQAESRHSGKPLRLQVLKMNRAARLYERLGFLRTGEDGLHEQMEWLAPPNS